MKKELKNRLYFILFSFFKFYNIFFIIKSMQFSASSCMHIELDSENTPLYEQGQDFVFKIPGIGTRYIKLILFIRWRIMSIPWLYNNLYGLHKLNQILLKDKCTPALWPSYLYLSTCLLHALLHTVDEPDNLKLWHFMNSALNFLQKFWNQILLNTRH